MLNRESDEKRSLKTSKLYLLNDSSFSKYFIFDEKFKMILELGFFLL